MVPAPFLFQATHCPGGHGAGMFSSLCRPRWSGRNKFQGQAVVTPALTGRLRPILEHMTLVATAAGTMILPARIYKFQVQAGFNGTGQGGKKTRPAGTTIEFHLRCEQRQGTGRTDKGTGPFFIVQRAGKGRFRSRLAKHFILLRRQQGPPFLIAFDDPGDRRFRL